MLKDMQKTSNANLKDDIQKASNANLDATMHSFERVTKATQAIVTEITDYSKRSFELEAFIRARHQDDGESARREVAG